MDGQHDPAGPRLACDLPVGRPGTVVHNELSLSGWAVSPVGISDVVVQIDDRLLHAAYGLDTPWATESMPEIAGSGMAGYRLVLDTSSWAPGPRQVTITAYDQRGERADIAGEVEIVPFEAPAASTEGRLAALAEGGIAFALERPSLAEDAPEVEGPVEISGWAHAGKGLDTVLVTIDGQTRYEALRPIARPDLLDDYGEEVAARAGFALQLHARDCPPGGHRLSVVAIDSERRAVGVETDLSCLPERPPTEAPAAGEAMPIDWLPAQPPPRRGSPVAGGDDPGQLTESLLEAGRELRRRLVAPLTAEQDVLDVTAGELAAGLAHEDASFDLLTCFEGLESAPEPDEALDELRRVLRADGVLLVAAPRRIGHALGERFANVRLHQRRSLLAAVVTDDDGAVEDDGPGAGIAVSKLGDWRPGGEDGIIAVASDEELPRLERRVVLAAPRALRRLRDTARAWEDRVLLAEADAAASRNEANLAKMHQEATVREWRDAQRDAEALRQSLAEARALHEGRTVEFEERKSELEEEAARLTERNVELEEQAARLTERNVELEEQAARLTERNVELEEQAARLTERNVELEEEAARLTERNVELEEQAARLAPAEQRAAGAEATLAAHESSLSWRITRPLRAVKRRGLLARNLIRRR